MGKRSSFEKIPKDAYQTIDPRAVKALLPFLKDHTRFAEQCVGEGWLSKQLVEAGHIEGYSSDIKLGKDALDLTSQDLKDAEMIITNPPWSINLLHPMIQHFSSLKSTWLLFYSDWAYTKQSATFMKDLCTDMVAVGRLTWIPDTKVSGKDNCSWYRFSTHKVSTTRFYGRTA